MGDIAFLLLLWVLARITRRRKYHPRPPPHPWPCPAPYRQGLFLSRPWRPSERPRALTALQTVITHPSTRLEPWSPFLGLLGCFPGLGLGCN